MLKNSKHINTRDRKKNVLELLLFNELLYADHPHLSDDYRYY